MHPKDLAFAQLAGLGWEFNYCGVPLAYFGGVQRKVLAWRGKSDHGLFWRRSRKLRYSSLGAWRSSSQAEARYARACSTERVGGAGRLR